MIGAQHGLDGAPTEGIWCNEGRGDAIRGVSDADLVHSDGHAIDHRGETCFKAAIYSIMLLISDGTDTWHRLIWMFIEYTFLSLMIFLIIVALFFMSHCPSHLVSPCTSEQLAMFVVHL